MFHLLQTVNLAVAPATDYNFAVPCGTDYNLAVPLDTDYNLADPPATDYNLAVPPATDCTALLIHLLQTAQPCCSTCYRPHNLAVLGKPSAITPPYPY